VDGDSKFSYTYPVRRALSISLLLLFSFLLISPLLGSDVVQANLPACCRRAGKHHCSFVDPGSQQTPGVGLIAEKCPHMPAITAAFHLSLFAPQASEALFAGLTAHPAIHAQTAAQYRISFDHSRQKRGPPALFLL
jgi:hypothetical protein